MSSKGPEVLRDVYRDLRDRRLLPIAIALVAAIIAVPFLLGGGGSDPVAAVEVNAASAEPPEGTPLLDPVVLSGQPGLRDPDERLKRLSNRNPFKQQSAAPPGDAAGGLQETDPTGGEGAGAVSDTSSATASVDTAPAPSTTPAVDEPSGSGGSPATSPPPDPPEQRDPPDRGGIRLAFFTIDVKAGPIGNARKMKDVKPGEYVPGEDHPLVQYLRGEFGEGAASFAVSKEVTAVEGEGRCVPDRSRCEFLQLHLGEEQRLTYGPDGKTYRIKLLDLVRHERALNEG